MVEMNPCVGSILSAQCRLVLHTFGPQGPDGYDHNDRVIIERGDAALILEDIKELRVWKIMSKERILKYETPYVWDDDWSLLV